MASTGITSCRNIDPGTCSECPNGKYKEKGLIHPFDEKCKFCPVGAEPTASKADCAWCDIPSARLPYTSIKLSANLEVRTGQFELRVGTTSACIDYHATANTLQTAMENAIRELFPVAEPPISVKVTTTAEPVDHGYLHKLSFTANKVDAEPPIIVIPPLNSGMSSTCDSGNMYLAGADAIVQNDIGTCEETCAAFKNGRSFPNNARSACRKLAGARLSTSANNNLDDVQVSWRYEDIAFGDQITNVRLCQLKFTPRHMHTKCLAQSQDPQTNVTLHDCAKHTNDLGSNAFSYYTRQGICEPVQDCSRQQGQKIGWHVYEIDSEGEEDAGEEGAEESGWKASCIRGEEDVLLAETVASLGAVVETLSLDFSSFLSSNILSSSYRSHCVKDTSRIMALLRLNSIDAGHEGPHCTLCEGEGTEIALRHHVNAISDNRDIILGNTPPRPSSINDIALKPDVIFSTSPIIACVFDIDKATDPDSSKQELQISTLRVSRGKAARTERLTQTAAQLRQSSTLARSLVRAFLEADGRIKPIDATMWPGDLRILAEERTRALLNSPLLLETFVKNCLSDEDAISDAEILALAGIVHDITDAAWTVFAESDGGEKFAMGRNAQHGIFGNEKLRCEVSLDDGCEVSRFFTSAHETRVKDLFISKDDNGEQKKFIAKDPEVVTVHGAGFLASWDTTLVTCTWAQPANGNYRQEEPSVLNSHGMASTFDSVSCTFPKWYGSQGAVQLSLSGPFLEYAGCISYSAMQKISSVTTIEADSRASYAGVVSCQFLATQNTPEANTFLLGTDTCSYVVANASAIRQLSVDDNLCDAVCTVPAGEQPQFVPLLDAKRSDQLQPQRCGSKNQQYASVFLSVTKSNIYAGAYEILTSPPEVPTFTIDKCVGGAGRIILHWKDPEFRGGTLITDYQLKFRRIVWESMNTTDMAFPSSHAALCRDSGEKDEWDGYTYRICKMGEALTQCSETKNMDPAFADSELAYDACSGINIGWRNSIVIEYLEPGVSYEFSLRARNGHRRDEHQGWSQYTSETVTVAPLAAAAPSQVRNLRLSDVADSARAYMLNVTWDVPLEDGGAYLSYYTLEISVANCDHSTEPNQLKLLTNSSRRTRQTRRCCTSLNNVETRLAYAIHPSLEQWARIGTNGTSINNPENLQPSTEYRIRVTATNAAGQESKFLEANFRTLDEVKPITVDNQHPSNNCNFHTVDESNICPTDGTPCVCKTFELALNFTFQEQRKVGQKVHLVAGTYNLRRERFVTASGVEISGQGAENTKIVCTGRCFSSSNDQLRDGNFVFLKVVRDISFEPETIPTLFTNTVQNGGAFFINGVRHSVRIENAVFAGFSASGLGGAIFAMDISNAFSVQIKQTLLISNHAGDIGGAVASVAAGLSMRESFVHGNSANFGGAIAAVSHERAFNALDSVRIAFEVHEPRLQISGSDFHENIAHTSGGVIYVAEGELQISDSNFGGGFNKKVGTCANVDHYWRHITRDAQGLSALTDELLEVENGILQSLDGRFEVQRIVLRADAPVSGVNVALSLSSTEICIPWHAQNETVAEEALNIASAGPEIQVRVTRSGEGDIVSSYGYVYSITFIGSADVLPLIAVDVNSSACNPDAQPPSSPSLTSAVARVSFGYFRGIRDRVQTIAASLRTTLRGLLDNLDLSSSEATALSLKANIRRQSKDLASLCLGNRSAARLVLKEQLELHAAQLSSSEQSGLEALEIAGQRLCKEVVDLTRAWEDNHALQGLDAIETPAYGYSCGPRTQPFPILLAFESQAETLLAQSSDAGISASRSELDFDSASFAWKKDFDQQHPDSFAYIVQQYRSQWEVRLRDIARQTQLTLDIFGRMEDALSKSEQGEPYPAGGKSWELVLKEFATDGVEFMLGNIVVMLQVLRQNADTVELAMDSHLAGPDGSSSTCLQLARNFSQSLDDLALAEGLDSQQLDNATTWAAHYGSLGSFNYTIPWTRSFLPELQMAFDQALQSANASLLEAKQMSAETERLANVSGTEPEHTQLISLIRNKMTNIESHLASRESVELPSCARLGSLLGNCGAEETFTSSAKLAMEALSNAYEALRKRESDRVASLEFIASTILILQADREKYRRSKVLETFDSNHELVRALFYRYAFMYDSYSPATTKGVYVDPSAGKNRAEERHGGSIMLQSAAAKIDGTLIASCISLRGFGGAVSAFASSLHVTDSSFDLNHAVNGGAIFASFSAIEISDQSALRTNEGFRDGGAIYLGKDSSLAIDDSLLSDNNAECPVRLGVTDCPDWQNTLRDGNVLPLSCINPVCKGHSGRGGAVYMDEATEFSSRSATYYKNEAKGGGCIFAKNTLDIFINRCMFEGCKCTSPPDTFFTAGGGAISIILTKHFALERKPRIFSTHFIDNFIIGGSGGAIFWDTPASMHAAVKEAGGLVRLEGYDSNFQDRGIPPLAHGNSATWGAQFIASGAVGLVLTEGPSKLENPVAETAKDCDGYSIAGVCPYMCSGRTDNGQQCVSFASLTTKAKPETVRGGVPLDTTAGVSQVKVAVVDFYNHVFETATDPILIEVTSNFAGTNLGSAWSESFRNNGMNNCTLTSGASDSTKAYTCRYRVSPQAREVEDEENAASTRWFAQALPEKGIATFTDLAVHALPTSICFESNVGKNKSLIVCTPDYYDIRITCPEKGLRVVNPDAAVRVASCQVGEYLSHDSNSCEKCPKGRYGDEINLHVEEPKTIPCKSCPKGYFQASPGHDSCDQCMAGRFTDEVALDRCKICINGTHTDGKRGQIRCESCPKGTYGGILGSEAGDTHYAVCKNCPVGRFQHRNFSTDILKEADSEGNSVKWDCESCPMGWQQPIIGQSKCVHCLAGTVSRVGSTACKYLCPYGTYRNESQYPQWIRGDAASRRNYIVRYEIQPKDICFPCPMGWSGSSSANPDTLLKSTAFCEPCALGREQPSQGSTRCTKCPKGTSAPDLGTPTCKGCQAGRYQREVGQSDCKSCESGRFNPQNRPDGTKCLVCPEGKWTNASVGNVACESCPAGRYGEVKSSASEEVAHHPNFGHCTLCAPNSFANSTEMRGACAHCAPGRWTEFEHGAQHCDACKRGYIFPGKVDRNCEKCASMDPLIVGDRGYYSFLAGDLRSACHKCPPGTFCSDGDDIELEWGWWKGRGYTEHVQQVQQSAKKSNLVHINHEECPMFSSGLQVSKGTASLRQDNFRSYHPLQCGDTCVEGSDPACRCATSAEGHTKCFVDCEIGNDYEDGLYMDKCGVPIKLSRCPSFQRRVSCGLEFKRQMETVMDVLSARRFIDMPDPCMACRPTSVINISAVERLKGTIKDYGYKQIAHVTTGLGKNVYVDPLWFFDGRMVSSPYSPYPFMADRAAAWPVVLITYSMPKSGIWDEDAYRTVLLEQAAKSLDARNKPHMNGEKDNITVALFENDPRLEYICPYAQGKGHGNCTYEGEILGDARGCNIFRGYYGRLCRQCLPGFSYTDGKCRRCPSYSLGIGKFVTGLIIGMLALVIMVSLTVADAGSTSTASSLKRILLNHMQLISMAVNYDLNWTPSVRELFVVQGAVSSFGEQIIDAQCILNSEKTPLVRPFYVIQIIFAIAPFAFMLLATVYWFYVAARRYSKGDSESARIYMETVQKQLLELQKIKRRRLRERMRFAHLDGVSTEHMEGTDMYAIMAGARKRQDHFKAINTVKKLRRAGIENIEAASSQIGDRMAIGRMRAREFMAHVRRHNIDLKEMFLEFEHKGPAGELPTNDFIAIMKSMNFKWPETDYLCVAEMFDAEDDEIEGKVSLGKITGFGKTFMDHVVLTWSVILYVMYPTNVRMALRQVSCVGNLMDGDHWWYLSEDLAVGCTSPEHIAFVSCIGLPVFLILIVGFPLAGIFGMRKSIRENGHTHDTTAYRHAIFMSGYRRSSWYWEAIICGRKLILISIGVFMKNFGTEAQFFFACFCIVVALALQLRVRPFSTDALNNLEGSGLGVLFFSLFMGLFFFWESFSESNLDIVAGIIVFVNVAFLMWCIGGIMLEYLHRHANSALSQVIILLHCKTENPFLLSLMAVPCLIILLGVIAYGKLTRCNCFCWKGSAYAKKKAMRLERKRRREEDEMKSREGKAAVGAHLVSDNFGIVGDSVKEREARAKKLAEIAAVRKEITITRKAANAAEESGQEEREERLRDQLRSLKRRLRRLMNQNVIDDVTLEGREKLLASKVTRSMQTGDIERKIEMLIGDIRKFRQLANAAEERDEEHEEAVARAQLRKLKIELRHQEVKMKWRSSLQTANSDNAAVTSLLARAEAEWQNKDKGCEGIEKEFAGDLSLPNLEVEFDDAELNDLLVSDSDSSTFSLEEEWQEEVGKSLMKKMKVVSHSVFLGGLGQSRDALKDAWKDQHEKKEERDTDLLSERKREWKRQRKQR
eukprot:g2462.t1